MSNTHPTPPPALPPARPRPTGRRAALATLAAFTAGPALLLLTSTSTAQDRGTTLQPASDVGQASEAELEMLRRLLGVPEPEEAEPAVAPPAPRRPQPPAPVPVAAPPPAPKPEPKPAAKPAPRPEPKPAVKPAPKPRPVPAARPAPEPAPKPVPAARPRPRPAPKPAVRPAPERRRPVPRRVPPPAVEAKEEAPEPAEAEAPVLNGAVAAPPSSRVAVPEPGTTVTADNLAEWKHLLGPSVQWSVERGAHLDVAAYRPLMIEKTRQVATQRYHAQVRLADDKRSIENYVAGIPFPLVTADDPDAAAKLMFNMENRINVDDLDVRNFSCDTGDLGGPDGFQIQRHYHLDHFRRHYQIGRMWRDPKPTLPDNIEGVRYREMLWPLSEPFDLKGAGFTYIRYLDPNRQDDSWLYFPQLKRVRRLGTAQRSEGVFGQDVDLDSYGGFAGNPAWTTWTLLGSKTMLVSLDAKRVMPKFQDAPATFFPDDEWAPRETWVILGISQLGGYNFGRRVIYLDREHWIVPYTEIYDLKGQLWRSLIHTWKYGDRTRPDAKRAVYKDNHTFIGAFTLIDMQLDHATRCQFPADANPNEEGWYYYFGEEEGTTAEVFSVANIISASR